MKPDFEKILEDCLEQLRRGQSVEDCLIRYPHEAEALRPLLRTAAQLQNSPIIYPRAEAVREGRQRVLAKANAILASREEKNARWMPVFRLAFSLIVVLLLSGFFVVGASAHSLPGNLLYGVKRGWEALRLELTISPRSRQSLEVRFSQTRWEEIDEMLAKNMQGTLDIAGVLDTMNVDSWIVSGQNVQVVPGSVIDGIAATGAWVTMRVHVYRDGSVVLLNARFGGEEGNPNVPPGGSKTPWILTTPVPVEPTDEDLQSVPLITPEDEATEIQEQDDDEADDEEHLAEPTHETEPGDEYEATEEVEPGGDQEDGESPEAPQNPQQTSEPTEEP